MYDEPYMEPIPTEMRYYVQQVPPPQPKKGFSREEIKNLAVAVGVMTVAFTLFYSGVGSGSNVDLLTILLVAIFVFVSVIPGFVVHELAHKLVAQKYGCWAEFRYSKQGLFLAVVTAFLGFIFAAPGAVYIRGSISEKQNGIISVAGPLTNIGIAIIFMPLFLLSPVQSIGWLLGAMGVRINLILAGFNLLPFGPLDGKKVFRWNPVVHIGLLILTIVLYALMFFPWFAQLLVGWFT